MKRVGRIGGFALALAALGACAAAPEDEAARASESALPSDAPGLRTVQMNGLAYRRIAIASAVGTTTTVVEIARDGYYPQRGDEVYDWGRLAVPSTLDEVGSTGTIYWKLRGILKIGSQSVDARWRSDLASAQQDVKAILAKLNALSGNGCKNDDWRLATFRDPNAPDFLCGTLSNGALSLGDTAPAHAGAGAGASFCALGAKVGWAAARDGGTVSLTFTRKTEDVTLGGQWYAADGRAWLGAPADDPFRCPDARCDVRTTKLTATSPRVTFTASDLGTRPVQFITSDGSCVFGPY